MLVPYAGEYIDLSFANFLAVLRRSATVPAPQDQEAGDELLAEQVRVLTSLIEDGVYNNQARGFGVNGDDGKRWYNFTVSTYIECGCAGAFGDDGSRGLSGGENAGDFAWKDLHNFFDCGRSYE